jgi:hypothetical protein
MSPTPDAQIDAAVAASVLLPRYGTPIDRESAREILTAKMNAAAEAEAAAAAAKAQAEADKELAKSRPRRRRRGRRRAERQKEYDRLASTGGSTRTARARPTRHPRAGAELEVDPDDPQLGHPRDVRHGKPLTEDLARRMPGASPSRRCRAVVRCRMSELSTPTGREEELRAVPRADGAAPRALVLGATGYIGGRLVPRLVAAGYRVRVLVRDPARLAAFDWADAVDVVAGTATDAAALETACADVDVLYYLIHSMGRARGSNGRISRRRAPSRRRHPRHPSDASSTSAACIPRGCR